MAPRHPPNALETLARTSRRTQWQKPPPHVGTFNALMLDRSATDHGNAPKGTTPRKPRQRSVLSFIHNVKDRPPMTEDGRQRTDTHISVFCPLSSALCLLVVGGADRGRTGDLLLAKQALSQLSYGPSRVGPARMVGLGRLELPTSPLSGVRSNQTELQARIQGSGIRSQGSELIPDT